MVVEPFNAAWFGFLCAMALVGAGLHLALRGRSQRVKAVVCAACAAGSVVLYTTYTFKSILNPAMPTVVLAQNLPFHFCNIVAWALIPAYLFEWPRLRTLCFFPGALAGLLTLTSPVPEYVGHPLWSLESIGFYGVHSMNVILGTLLASLGFIRPTWWGAVKSVGYLFTLALAAFPLDAAMRAWVDPGANYFYLFNPENADILVMAHNAIPVPLIYMIPLVPVALAGTLVQAALYKGASRLAGRLRPPGPPQDPAAAAAP
jgi:uncharacterized membrane protein YwaF